MTSITGIAKKFFGDCETGKSVPRILAVLIAVTAAMFTGPAQAASYPVRPVRMVVPFPASGATDVLARIIAQKLPDAFGQQVVVDNQPGAGGTARRCVYRSPHIKVRPQFWMVSYRRSI